MATKTRASGRNLNRNTTRGATKDMKIIPTLRVLLQKRRAKPDYSRPRRPGLRLAAMLTMLAVLLPGAASATDVLLIEDQGGFGTASTVLTNDGHNVTVVNNEYANGYANLQDQAFLETFDMVVWGARGAGFGNVTPGGVITSLESYIQNGGNLLVTGYDTIGSPDDPGLAALVRSSTDGDRVSSDSNWNVANVDNYILNGPYGDFRGSSFTASGYDDDNLTADTGAGAVALVTYPPGDRIIFTDLPAPAGSVGYWNGGNSGTTTNAQPDFSDAGAPEGIFRNWVAGSTTGAPATIPTLGPIALLLATLLLAAFGARGVKLTSR